MKEITKFVSDDEREFRTKQECASHERNLRTVDFLMNLNHNCSLDIRNEEIHALRNIMLKIVRENYYFSLEKMV